MEKQAYIFITLPDSLHPVICGVIRESPDGFLEFMYAKSYVKNSDAIPLDPIKMPISDTQIFLGKNDYSDIGAIRDAMPDSWGRFLIEKKLQSSKISEIDYMLYSAGERVGALDFSSSKDDQVSDLNSYTYAESLGFLQEAIKNINIDKFDDRFYDILKFGSSMGGARPKTVIEDGNALWLAKFNRKSDSFNYARLEYANMTLAKIAGLDVPEVNLISVNNDDVFLIKRFDREKDLNSQRYYKHHFLSALTVTNRLENDSHLSSYAEIAAAIRQISSFPKQDLLELYRRMVFNILCNNTDDHLRNHGFLRSKSGYRISPAYDIVPSITSSHTKYLTLNVGNFGKVASIENALSSTNSFGIFIDEAKQVILEMLMKIRSWRDVYKKCGVSQTLIELLADKDHGTFGRIAIESVQ